MAEINLALQKVLANEGGYVNDPDDPGGATKYGVTQSDMPDVDIQSITPEQATAYYQAHFINPLYTSIRSQAILDKLVDMGVLFGFTESVLLLQFALALKMDGVFGPVTLSAVNSSDCLQHYKDILAQHAYNIVRARPRDAKFYQGWLNRIAS